VVRSAELSKVHMSGVRSDLRLRFERDGFASITEPIVSQPEVRQVAELVDGLFRRVDDLPAEFVHDLGTGGGGGRILEVVRTSELAPALRRTAAFRRLRAIAEEVLGGVSSPVFDHAIHKPPLNRSATAWHQDAAYSPRALEDGPAVTLWLALQDTTVHHGCMRFIPGTHETVLAHRPRGGDAAAWARETVEVDESLAVDCPIPAGGVTLHNPVVLHGAGPNDTDEPRRAWIVQFRPADRRGPRGLLPGWARHMADEQRVRKGA
jgi:hypothetical protein